MLSALLEISQVKKKDIYCLPGPLTAVALVDHVVSPEVLGVY